MIPSRSHDACGVGFVTHTSGQPSRLVVDAALEGLAAVRHRGAVAADARTSDGTGLLTTLPGALYGEGVGVALLFTRPGAPDPTEAIEQALVAEGLEPAGWRTPPTDDSVLGDLARAARPEIRQVLFRAGDGLATTGDPAADEPGTDGPADDAPRPPTGRGVGGADPAERAAYRARRRVGSTCPGTYVVSCSFRTVTHKGLVAADALAAFWLDLADPAFTAHLAIFHQRFSTNTLPTWERAQPFRTLAHNGEINTIWGNVKRLEGRGRLGTEEAGLGDESLFHPLVDPEDSDSGMLDEVVELLVRAGRHPGHAVAMLVPEAWEHTRDLAPEVRGFYEYHSALVEPWDGPAGIVFSDGVGVGAALDRNGLRPLRYAIAEDGLVVCASEAGAVDLSGHGAIERGRLGPGHMLWVDPVVGVARDGDVKREGAALAPFARWADEGFSRLDLGRPDADVPEDLAARQVAHGYTKEELAMVLKPMAADAAEPTFSMGDDSPLPPMAGRGRPVAHFLRQRFAQVTNPPIDPLRERLVTSTRVLLGPRAPLLSQSPEAAHLLALESFFAFPSGVAALDDPARNPFRVAHLDARFPAAEGPSGLSGAVDRIADEAAGAVAAGRAVLVIGHGDADADHVPVPGLLAVGAVHQALVASGRRDDASLVLVADDLREVHGIAMAVAAGADLVCPRLALATVAAEADAADSDSLVAPEAQTRFRVAVEAGVRKVCSKMGIATVDSYRGTQLFDAVGLDAEVVDRCFTGTATVVGGLGWRELGEDALARHAAAWAHDDGEPALESPGFIRVRKGGEDHGKSKEVVSALNDLAAVAAPPAPAEGDGSTDGNGSAGTGSATSVSVPSPARPAATGAASSRAVQEMTAAHLLQRAIADGGPDAYAAFRSLVERRAPLELHDLLELVEAPTPVPLAEVEPVEAIVRRFTTGAMSHGALSREAHENLARAMNLLGARSNCGEGGEDPARFRTRGLGRDDANSRIKQVASGRFGVTAEYLAFADEIQIKIAQGSKPGEGGQLPGHKVSAEIARLRHTQPGVGLISPPPHHDIYSIEDLAQLIYDLKQVGAAQVSVKLVAEDGVGTVAAGVVKALADAVHISGANGGTGASPLSSIKHAGLPWELGLVDAQRALVDNGLRSRARLATDGGFLTGRHVVVAALLGADEYSFGTAAMIAEGCIMLRACHRDTCKPGVATQRPNLRANFTGTPEGVATYFWLVAEEVREHLSRLGARTLDEVVGRVDLLRQRATGDERVDAMDLAPLLAPPAEAGRPRRFVERSHLQDPRSELGDRLLADAYRAVWEGDRVDLAYDVTTADRTIGASLSGALALEFGSTPPRGHARASLTGSAGQSLGAFLGHGVALELTGEANDYVGKGMSGGRIAIRPGPDTVGADASGRGTPVLAGNTCLYGATGGELFVAGGVGERFAVRNSGASGVVEATGDHCAEYMTGGTIVVLGRIGYNLGAGMTGGQVFVWDPEIERVLTRVNEDLVEVLRPDRGALEELVWLVERHVELTGSPRGAALLADWEEHRNHLWHVLPRGRAERVTNTQAARVGAA